MPVTLTTQQLKYKDPNTGNYVGVNAVAETSTAEHMAAINSLSATQMNNIQIKGQETIASIPSDYTTLSNTVSDLKSALSNVADSADCMELVGTTATNAGYLDSDGTVHSNASFKTSDFIDVTKYRVLNVYKSSTQTTGLTVAFYTSNSESSYIANSGRLLNEVSTKTVITIPTNAVYMRFCKRTQGQDFYGILVTNIDDVKKALAAVFSPSYPYKIGEIVSKTENYVFSLYKYISAHSAGAWNDAEVKNVTLADEIEKAQLQSEMIAYRNGDIIVDLPLFTNGGYLTAQGKLQALAAYKTTNFIPVNNLKYIKIYRYVTQSSGLSVAFYSSNDEDTYITNSGVLFNTDTGIRTITIPAKAEYFRICTQKNGMDGICYSDELAGDKIRLQSIYGKSYVSEQSPIYYRNRKNLYNSRDLVIGHYLANGDIRDNDDYYYTNPIPVKQNTDYVISKDGSAFTPFCIAAYDNESDSKAASYLQNLTVSSGVVNTGKANYVRICSTLANASVLQFEQGTTITSYEKYYETDAKKIVDKLNSDSGLFALSPKKLTADVFLEKVSVIKLLGDSITAGYGGTGYNSTESGGGDHIYGTYYENIAGTCWANMLKDHIETKYPNCTVKNYGCSGNYSKDVVDHLSSLIQATDDVIVLMIGTNNRADNRFDRLYSDLVTIITYCERNDKQLILMGCIPSQNESSLPKTMQDVNDCITAVGKEYGIPTINLYNAMCEYLTYTGTELSTILTDGLHPNDTGYGIMYRLIGRALGFAIQ